MAFIDVFSDYLVSMTLGDASMIWIESFSLNMIGAFFFLWESLEKEFLQQK